MLMNYLLASAVLASVVALLYARWEYRKRGKLTVIGLFLLCVMIFMPNLLLEYATRYEMPETVLDYVGVFIGLVGLAICVFSMIHFRSVSKILCIDTGDLTLSGPYQWSRNPQYVGWVLFLLGFGLTDWSLWCLAALLVVAISLHLLVLIEEEHLRRVFGETYVEFCQKTPRYLDWG